MPRVANEIRLVTPTNVAAPITADDYDVGLPLSFKGGFYHYRILLPFLPCADEVVAAGNRPTKAAIPLFEIEDLALAFVVWEPAATMKRLVDSTVGYIKRVLAHLFSQHFSTWTEPFASAS